MKVNSSRTHDNKMDDHDIAMTTNAADGMMTNQCDKDKNLLDVSHDKNETMTTDNKNINYHLESDDEVLHDKKIGSFHIEEKEQLLREDSVIVKNEVENGDNTQIEPESEESKNRDVIIITDVEKTVLEVPDGGYGWLVVFGSFMVHFVIGGIERSAGLLYLQFLDRYHKSATITAWLTAMAAGIRLMLGPLTGALSHRFSCRSTIMWGGVITCISMVISGFSPDLYFQFFSFGVLGGIGRSFAYCPAVVIVGYYFNKKRGRAVGIATSGVGFGTFVIPPIIEIVFKHYGFTGAFMIIAGITFNLAVFGILMRPLSTYRRIEAIQSRRKEKLVGTDEEITLPSKKIRRDDNLYDSVDFTIPVLKDSERIPKNSSFSNFKRRLSSAILFTKSKQKTETKVKTKKKMFEFSLLKDYRFACFCVAILLFTIAFQSAFVFLPPFVKQIGGSDTKAAFSIVIAGVFDGIGRLTAGFVLDLKRTRPYRYYIYNGIMFILGCISMIIPSLTSFVPLGIVCGFYGFFTGSYISQKSVIIVDLLGPEKLTFSFGIMILFQGIGMMVGPMIGGFFKDVNGTYDFSFYFGGSSMLVGAVILATSNIIYCLRSRK